MLQYQSLSVHRQQIMCDPEMQNWDKGGLYKNQI